MKQSRSFTPVCTLPRTGNFTVAVERGGCESRIDLVERNEFGVGRMSFSIEEAKQVGLYLLRVASAVAAEDEVVVETVEAEAG